MESVRIRQDSKKGCSDSTCPITAGGGGGGVIGATIEWW